MSFVGFVVLIDSFQEYPALVCDGYIMMRILGGQYELRETVGEGSYSMVYCGWDRLLLVGTDTFFIIVGDDR